jgi:bZIP transcription factor
MSSTHASATTRLPPPVIPLEELPSASIVQLPPSYNNKIPKVTTTTTSTPTPTTTTSTTTTTVTNPNLTLQPSLPTLDTSSQLSFPTTLQPATTDMTMQQACSYGYSESRTPNLSFSETSWHNNNGNNNSYNFSSSSSLSSVHSNRVVTKHENTIPPFSTITTNNNHDLERAAAAIPTPNIKQSSSSVLSEKKLRRLEKNRLSARECRRRKREATQDMEQEICRLEGENLKLRLQLRVRETKTICH